MFRSILVLGIVTITACGAAPVTFCERLEANAAHVKTVLASCPGSGDDALYGFSKSKCDTKGVTDCTAADQTTLLAISDCNAKVTACFVASDRDRAVKAIQACSGNATFTPACSSAISP